MRQVRRRVTGMIAAGCLLAGVSACGSPAYTYATDSQDQTYFKVPSSWYQINPRELAEVQSALLVKSPLGALGGSYSWSRAYSALPNPPADRILTASTEPIVYVSVQNMDATLRSELSFDVMRDVLFPVTATARQEAAAAGAKLSGFNQISSSTFTTGYGLRGINELYEYNVGGVPDAFDQTVLTNVATDKLYVMLVQCYQACFVANEKQIATIINSFLVRGSS
jgi:hypothetical protein